MNDKLREAAARVVRAWVSTRPAWIEQCNEAVLALDAALKAEPQDAELSAALGWPGGISNPVLDRKVLLQKVAALMQDKLWEDHRVRHLWDHTTAHQPEPAQEPITRIFGTLPVHDAQQPEPVGPVAWADKISFENAMKTGKGHDVWPKAGDYEARTGRALIGLYTAPPQRPTLTVPELQQALVDAGIIFPEAIDDAEGFDHGVTLERIDALHAAIIKTTGGAT